ncbi:kyphoscoliosis peptidase-like isoform X2 [Hemicordylus capensis]|uniref:kyphoscoliosis peptidase-like isoform X2 n=1 Tax=Hemicordylus capensis TaxID=884348 RepID=UPI00230319B0|nr:kyphoscoliosis peptidase-like isoform X2 [Hemicordylus capensis]
MPSEFLPGLWVASYFFGYKYSAKSKEDEGKPAILTNLQDFAKSKEDEGKPAILTNLQDYPWDKSSKKSMPIEVQQFKELDEYVLKQVDVKDSMENLVSALLKKAHSDLEKVRAIWMWTCHNIEYDVKAYHTEAKWITEPAEIFQFRKCVCSGYAAFFGKMCSIAGIECKKLSGFAKGKKKLKGFKNPNHSWNAVYLDGRWHLLDSTWGSGYVTNSSSKFVFCYNEFYFLTHPAFFIDNHFPEDPKWQLLKPALTLEQYADDVQ